MEKNLLAQWIDNYFANGEVGIQLCLFRNKIVLTKQEAYELQKNIQAALWGKTLDEKKENI